MICRAGSFGGAARVLGVSQPTLSKSIARLEAELSLKLFERRGTAARPTVYGEIVAKRAEALLNGAEALATELEQVARGEEGRLRILVGPVARLRPLPALVRMTSARFPRLRVEATQARGRVTAMRSLTNGRYDMLIGNSHFAREHGEMIRVHLYDDTTAAAVRPGHPALQHETPIEPASLLRYPVASSKVSPMFEGWVGEATPEQAGNLDAFISDDYRLTLDQARHGDFVAIAPSFLFQADFRAGTLVNVPLTLAEPYSCWLITTPERWRSPVVRAIAEMAKAAAQEGVPPGAHDDLAAAIRD